MYAHNFERTHATSMREAMRQFIARFRDEDELHAYILDNDLGGLTFTDGGQTVQCRFFDMPSNAWEQPYRNSPRVARP